MKLLVFAEQREGVFKKSAFETLSAANKISKELNSGVLTVVIGNRIEELSKELKKYGAEKIVLVENPKLEKYSTSVYAKIIANIVEKENCDIVFLPATSMGKDLAPRLSAKLSAALATDCVELKVVNNDIIATRPVYAGKSLIDIKIKSQKKIFSLRPNVFPVALCDGAASFEKIEIPIDDTDFISLVKEIVTLKGKKDVAEADIIITGGRGMKGPEHFKLIEELADLMNGAVGASRAVVDAGWRPHSEQVGQTGKTVSPTLYIACGISGAIQHLAGMSTSKYIVAINKDKDAPIFQYADYGIIGDVFEILPSLRNELKTFLNK
jgi:electron transfer flavoprotein alpha subunit